MKSKLKNIVQKGGYIIYFCQTLYYKQNQMNNHNNHQEVNVRKNSQFMDEKKDDENVRQIYQVERYVYSIVDYVINVSAHVAYRNHQVMSLLQVYSQEKILTNINQINDLFVYTMSVPNSTQQFQQSEPEPLRIDSLLPISADIDHEKPTYKNLSFGGMSEIRSRATLTARQHQSAKEVYLKLDLPAPQEQDGLTKQLRRMEEQRQTKVHNEKKQQQKKQKIRQQKLKDKKNQKQQKFSYGYNGELIQVKLQNKNNLISKVINGFTDNKGRIIKQVFNDPNPTRLEGVRPGKKDSKLINPYVSQKSKNDVQFSQIKSLAQNIKTTNGVKYTYQGKTYEEKRKIVTETELKKTLSQRRLTKQEFIKIRNSNGNRGEFQQMRKSTMKDNNQNQVANSLRVKSQSKISQSTNVKMKEIIRVNSKNLKQKLLERQLNPPPISDQNQEHQEESISEQKRLGLIDNFNIQYIRTGGSLQTKTSKQFFTIKINQLPKINHTTLYSKAFPKGRQRIKDSNEIIRDLRKRFEQKLRV